VLSWTGWLVVVYGLSACKCTTGTAYPHSLEDIVRYWSFPPKHCLGEDSCTQFVYLCSTFLTSARKFDQTTLETKVKTRILSH
jgi:hypothetical protein